MCFGWFGRQYDHFAQNGVELLCRVVRLIESLFVIGIGWWEDVGMKTKVPNLAIVCFGNRLVSMFFLSLFFEN